MAGVTSGSVVAGYTVGRLIGRGATGAVYLAEDAEGRQAALKVLMPELAGDARFRERFLREAQIARSLDEPHVVPTLATGDEDGILFQVMAYVDGSDLREILKREGSLSPARAVDLIGQVACALDAAHALGLVHRDVKPGNILVAPSDVGEQAFLCDFGLAKHLSSAQSLTGERAFVGTIAYISPEQIEGAAIDARTDVYSLGCVLFECLTGEAPFARESELAAVYAHINEQPPRASELQPGVPAGLDAVIARALAKDPKERFASCGELAAAGEGALRGDEPAGRGHRRRRRTLVALAAVALVTAAVVAGTLQHGGRTAAPARLAIAPKTLGIVDPATRAVVGTIAFSSQPWDVAFGSRQAWVLLGDEHRVARVDLGSRRVRSSVKLPFSPGGITVGGGSTFVTEDNGPGLVRLDGTTGRIAETMSVPIKGNWSASSTGIAFGAGSLWVARGAETVRVDPADGRVIRRVPTPLTASQVVFAQGAVWVASAENGRVVKIDPATNQITAATPLHGTISDLAVDRASVWVSIVPDDVVYRLSPDDGSVLSTTPAGVWPASLAAGARLWIADAKGRQLLGVTPTGGREALALRGTPVMARAHAGLLWVSAARPAPITADAGAALRIPLVDDAIGNADPAVTNGPVFTQLSYSTCAYLLNYPDAAGAAGRTLRPEVAAALPAISRDGRTYTFRIRPGFRFSPPSGQTLTAETFRFTIERALSPRFGSGGRPSPAAAMLADVVGATAYASGRAAHISGITVRGPTITIRLMRAAGDLPARLLSSYFCPVPIGTPAVAGGGTAAPIPMAGPYYVASTSAGTVVVERNPNYTGTRPRRSARIVYTVGTTAAAAISRVERGQADYLSSSTIGFDPTGPLALGGSLDRAYGLTSRAGRAGNARYVASPAPGVDAIAFNTRRALFHDARMRRAVAYALDRTALARVFGEQPSDRLIPPAVSGLSGELAYPVEPNLVAARRLAGHGNGRRAILYYCGPPVNERIAAIVRADLAPLGIDVHVDRSLGCLTGPETARLARADLELVSHFDPLADPSPFVELPLGDPYTAPGYWTDAALRRRIERARSTRGAARVAAYSMLGTELVRREAPVVVYASAISPELFSARIGCKVTQSALEMADLGALCVRRA